MKVHLTYKAPEGNEGYDLICIHPEPRYKARRGEMARVRIQVKSRYATDADRGFPINEAHLDDFDFLVLVRLNIGKFGGRHDGTEGAEAPEFYTLTPEFIRAHHDTSSTWQKVRLGRFMSELERSKNEIGFELIAQSLGVERPRKRKSDT